MLHLSSDCESGSEIPTVVIAVAGRSNGLGPVCSGNCSLPVINCPPMDANKTDIWSSINLPSGRSFIHLLFHSINKINK